MADLQIVPSSQILERISMGKHTRSVRVAGSLDVDPLVVSRWLCGENMRGIYQPIILCDCVLEELGLEACTFYELVKLSGCRVAVARLAQAYFYSALLIENCVFTGLFDGQRIQSDGGVVIRNSVFTGRTDWSGASLRGEVDLVGVSFPGGTNLLHILADELQSREGGIRLDGCQFRAADIPARLSIEQLGQLGINNPLAARPEFCPIA